MPNPNTKVVELFSGTPWECGLLQTLLKDAGIESFLKDNVLQTYLYDPIKSGNAKVMILETDLKEASAIAKAFLSQEL